jgi:hypothetical protein
MAVHFGDWLAAEIARLAISQAEFARRADVPLPTLRTWLKTSRSEIRGGNLQKLAAGLSKEPNEIKTILRKAYYEATDASIEVPIHNRPGERLVMRPVPIFNKISAAKFMERTNLDYYPGFADREVPAPTDDPEAFAMVVDGGCMEPDYRSGEIVVFSPLEVQRYGVQSGKDYAIQLDSMGNQENTFKRVMLDARDESIFILKCVNPKFKGPEKVKKERVVRLARAIWVSRPPPRAHG